MSGQADTGPADPFTGLGDAAVNLHTLYEAYTGAGFTMAQATYLTAVVLACSLNGSPGGGPSGPG